MADTSIPRVALGATTAVRKWFMDINTSVTAIPTWIGVFGMQEFKPATAATAGDTSDFSSSWKGNQTTSLAWTLEGKVKRASTAATATTYDPGQEVLRLKSVLIGLAGRVHVRWYEMEPGGPRIEAYEGFGSVEWTEEGGSMEALSIVTFKVNGDGARIASAHPSVAV